MRQLTVREVIVHLLNTYQDALDTMDRDSDSGIGGKPGSKCLLHSPLWRQGSYAALERGLRELRDKQPRVYWHVAEKHLRAVSKIGVGCVECRQPTDRRHVHKISGKYTRFDPQPITMRVVSRAVREDEVARGVEWLARWFGECGVTPFLPLEIYESVAA